MASTTSATTGGTGGGGDIDKTWMELQGGIDLVMNHLEQGMSYQKYMQWYTYGLFIRVERGVVSFKVNPFGGKA
jgi:hypothetical protein